MTAPRSYVEVFTTSYLSGAKALLRDGMLLQVDDGLFRGWLPVEAWNADEDGPLPAEVIVVHAASRDASPDPSTWFATTTSNVDLWIPSEDSDWSLLCGLAAHRGVIDSPWDWDQDDAEGWAHGPITHTEMAATFGPDWIHVVALVRKAAGLTPEQRSAYYQRWSRIYNEDTAAWSAAWRAVVVGSGPGGAALRALLAVGVVGNAVVAAALARRSELTSDTEREAYDLLSRAWREEFGSIHPDDPVLERAS